jgi:hypothetical protein
MQMKVIFHGEQNRNVLNVSEFVSIMSLHLWVRQQMKEDKNIYPY